MKDDTSPEPVVRRGAMEGGCNLWRPVALSAHPAGSDTKPGSVAAVGFADSRFDIEVSATEPDASLSDRVQ